MGSNVGYTEVFNLLANDPFFANGEMYSEGEKEQTPLDLEGFHAALNPYTASGAHVQDLVFQAPKSLSILAFAEGGEPLLSAYKKTVVHMLDYLYSWRENYGVKGARWPFFHHSIHWGTENQHLHTHILVAEEGCPTNLTNDLAPGFYSALVAHLDEIGPYPIEVPLDSDSSFEISGVPQEKIKDLTHPGEKRETENEILLRLNKT